jgi:hypothetical protein
MDITKTAKEWIMSYTLDIEGNLEDDMRDEGMNEDEITLVITEIKTILNRVCNS